MPNRPRERASRKEIVGVCIMGSPSNADELIRRIRLYAERDMSGAGHLAEAKPEVWNRAIAGAHPDVAVPSLATWYPSGASACS